MADHSNRKTNRKRKSSDFLVQCFMGVLVIGLLISLIWPDRAFSSLENRPLQGFPSVSFSSFMDGSAGKKMKDWFEDQFVGRNALIHLNYLADKASGSKEIKDVFLGSRTLVGQNKEPQKDVWKKNLKGMQLLGTKSQLPSYVLAVPGAADVQKQKLPAFAPVIADPDYRTALQEIDNEYVTNIDLYSLLGDHSNEYIFYNTDHHWTSYGAGLSAQRFFEVRKAVEDSMRSGDDEEQEEELMRLTQFSALQVSDSFQGTYASKTGSVGISDDVYIYRKTEGEPAYTVRSADGTKASIYNMAALKQKDQYELFLGKNQALIQIETDSPYLGRHLLLLKDSYANSLVQFLLPYYRTITVVDPRYFYGDIDVLLSSYSISEIMYVFGEDSLTTDNSLSSVLDTYEGGLYPAENNEDAPAQTSQTE